MPEIEIVNRLTGEPLTGDPETMREKLLEKTPDGRYLYGPQFKESPEQKRICELEAVQRKLAEDIKATNDCFGIVDRSTGNQLTVQQIIAQARRECGLDAKTERIPEQ